MMHLKYCGFTNEQDLHLAYSFGIRIFGFIFYPKSPRHVTSKQVHDMTQKLPPFVIKVGVFVNESASVIQDTIQTAGLSCIQLHGEESPEFCQQFHCPVIKAFRVFDEKDLSFLSDYSVSAVLLDSKVPDQYGGTGQTFNWALAIKAKQHTQSPLILSGGIHLHNIEKAIKEVSPYAIDMASGIEIAPGQKDPDKMRAIAALVTHQKNCF